MAVITSLVSDQGSGHAGGEEAGHGTGDVRPEGQPGEVPAAFLGQRAEGCNLEKTASFVLKGFLGIAQRASALGSHHGSTKMFRKVLLGQRVFCATGSVPNLNPDAGEL